MKKILLIIAYLTIISCSNEKMKTEFKALESELKETKVKLEEEKSNANYSPGLVHTVFFWLKEDLSQDEKAAFLAGLKSLNKINSVKKMHIGPPAPTEAREVVDQSFSYAAIFYFDDIEGQNSYQVDPIHVKFAEEQKGKWTKVLVYDNTISD